MLSYPNFVFVLLVHLWDFSFKNSKTAMILNAISEGK